MGFINRLKGWFDLLFTNRAKEEFNVSSVVSTTMENEIKKWGDIFKGVPYWANEDIKTINMAKSVCSEVARLATLAIGISISGSARAEWLQKQIDALYFDLRAWVEYAAAYGTVILKPNGESVDIVFPDQLVVTDVSGDSITGAVFFDKVYDAANKKYYTRLEHQHFLSNGLYAITNRCFVSDEDGKERRIDIEKTPWAGMHEEVNIDGLDRPLFAVLKMPQANNIEPASPFGMSIFAGAEEELKDLDIAYTRNAREIFDSKRTVLLDSDRLLPTGGKVSNSLVSAQKRREQMGLPDYVKVVQGDGTGDVYHEINPTLQTDTRITGINALLSQIGYKSGFANGYYVFNETTGIQTATQVEADQQRTVQTTKDVRDKIEICIEDLVYALNAFADLYDLAPLGVYEITYDFGDITYNREEDRARWYSYVVSGKIPFWYFLVKFEGLTEEEAKELEAAAKNKTEPLFGVEE